MSTRKVLVIGLDCATPQFVFGENAFDLPNIRRCMQEGCWGRLESCHPPITVPAWASMMSSKDPGTLGYYGFRNRRDRSYSAMVTADARSVQEPRVWDILSRRGKKVVLLGIPQTYPIRPVNGCVVAGFPAPDDAPIAFPSALKSEIENHVGKHIVDVREFRTREKDHLLEQIYELMNNRFDVAEYLIKTKPWDFFMLVEMGVDRIHHGFWQFVDRSHPKHQPGNPYERVMEDYYKAVDARIGRLLQHVGEDTAVIIVSDHGAKPMFGGICINQWLIEKGYLVVRDELSKSKRIEDCDIDWSRTRAWSSGGYYARLFINVAGREPEGIVPQAEYEAFRTRLAGEIESMVDPEGRLLKNRAHRPESIYRMVNGIAPDLIIYFGDLHWRAVGTVGMHSIYTFENDTGPDEANHDYHGIFILDDRNARGGEELESLQLMDVAPTVLDLMGVPVPEDMQGTSVIAALSDAQPRAT